MVQHVDLLRLYREFQLQPGASVDDLKLAYRRQISLVHPDRLRAKDEISQHLANERLKMLTTLYEAGMQFHRQHGRLPGAAAVRSEAHADAPGLAAPISADRSRSGHRRWWWLLALVIAGVGYWLLGTEPALQPAPIGIPLQVRPVPVPVVATPRYDGIQHGMPKSVVIEVLGAPIATDQERWYYGPSWLRFEQGKLAEWYSSPLRRLRISHVSDDWHEPTENELAK